MALQVSYTDKHGLVHASSYSVCTVNEQRKIKSGGNYHVVYTMEVHPSANEADDVPVGKYTYSFEVDKALSTPVIDQCYADAKTRDEFDGATDV